MATSDIERVVLASQQLEHVLTARLGARGNGLGEKLHCVEARIPRSVLDEAFYVVKVRNDVVHRMNARIPDQARFARAEMAALSGLNQVAHRHTGQRADAGGGIAKRLMSWGLVAAAFAGIVLMGRMT